MLLLNNVSVLCAPRWLSVSSYLENNCVYLSYLDGIQQLTHDFPDVDRADAGECVVPGASSYMCHTSFSMKNMVQRYNLSVHRPTACIVEVILPVFSGANAVGGQGQATAGASMGGDNSTLTDDTYRKRREGNRMHLSRLVKMLRSTRNYHVRGVVYFCVLCSDGFVCCWT